MKSESIGIVDAERRFSVSDEDHPEYETGRKSSRDNRAQLENGYSNLANQLIEKLSFIGCTGTEYQVVLAIIRFTYGWHRRSARILREQMADMAGIHPVNCSKALNSLIKKNIIFRVGGKFGEIGINTETDSWIKAKKLKNENVAKTTTFSKKVAKTTTKKVAKTTTHIKIDKDIKNLSSSGDDRGGEKSPKTEKLNGTKSAKIPACPHEQILAAWGEHCSFAPQPRTWDATRKAKMLSRWRAGFEILHRDTGKPLYTDEESGIEWWGRFFRYIKTQTFLPDAEWSFTLDWVIKPANFAKIIDGAYQIRGRS